MAAQRAAAGGQAALKEEREHSKQYRQLAEGAERERDELSKLSTDFKAASEVATPLQPSTS